MRSRRMIAHDEFLRVVEPNGKALIFYSKIDRLEQHLKELSPADGPLIDEFIHDMRFFSERTVPLSKPRNLMGPEELAQLGAGMLPYAAAMARWAKISIAEFAGPFQDPFLRRALPSIFAPDAAMSSFFFFLPGLEHGDCGVPEGGSLEFARAIEQRYLQLGGQVHYGCRVAKILIEPTGSAGDPACGRAVGIRLAHGREYHANTVVSAADGHTTLFEMLEGRFVTDGWQGAYEKLPVWDPVVQVTLGVRRDLAAEPHWAVRLLDRPVTIGGRPRTLLPVRHFCYDPSLAPAGHSVVQTLLSTDYR